MPLSFCFAFRILGEVGAERYYDATYPFQWLGIVGLIVSALMFLGFIILEPNSVRVYSFFGTPVGVLKKTGFHMVNPFYTSEVYSTKTRNYESDLMKVNDGDGTPIEISAAIKWRLEDPELAHYELDSDVSSFLKTQVEGNLRTVVSKYPYDAKEDDAKEDDAKIESNITLIKSSDFITNEIMETINKDVTQFGVVIDDVNINSLSYAPEIAAAMTQRQQAKSIMDAKKELSEGVVGVVKNTITNLTSDENGAINLSSDQKAELAMNLTIVLYGNSSPETVIRLN